MRRRRCVPLLVLALSCERERGRRFPRKPRAACRSGRRRATRRGFGSRLVFGGSRPTRSSGPAAPARRAEARDRRAEQGPRGRKRNRGGRRAGAAASTTCEPTCVRFAPSGGRSEITVVIENGFDPSSKSERLSEKARNGKAPVKAQGPPMELVVAKAPLPGFQTASMVTAPGVSPANGCRPDQNAGSSVRSGSPPEPEPSGPARCVIDIGGLFPMNPPPLRPGRPPAERFSLTAGLRRT